MCIRDSDQSLRSSLLSLREQLRALPGDRDALRTLADTVISLLPQYGSLRVAGLYRVLDNEQVELDVYKRQVLHQRLFEQV